MHRTAKPPLLPPLPCPPAPAPATPPLPASATVSVSGSASPPVSASTPHPTSCPCRFSRNQEISTIHVQDANAFVNSVKWNIIPGDTILFDFIFFIHPTAIGHWWEMLGPMYSVLKKVTTFKRPCDQFILLHMKRQHVLEWVRAMIAVTLGVGLDQELPHVLIQEETDNAWDQISRLIRHSNPIWCCGEGWPSYGALLYPSFN